MAKSLLALNSGAFLGHAHAVHVFHCSRARGDFERHQLPSVEERLGVSDPWVDVGDDGDEGHTFLMFYRGVTEDEDEEVQGYSLCSRRRMLISGADGVWGSAR